MRHLFIIIGLCFVSTVFIRSGRHLLALFLFLDILLFFILMAATFTSSIYFILSLVFCVFRAALGITLLIRRVRTIGKDKILILF